MVRRPWLCALIVALALCGCDSIAPSAPPLGQGVTSAPAATVTALAPTVVLPTVAPPTVASPAGALEPTALSTVAPTTLARQAEQSTATTITSPAATVAPVATQEPTAPLLLPAPAAPTIGGTMPPAAAPVAPNAPALASDASPLKRRELPPEGVDAQLAVGGQAAGGGGAGCATTAGGEPRVDVQDAEIGTSFLICFAGFSSDQPVDVQVALPDGTVRREQLTSDVGQGYIDFGFIWRALPGDPLGEYFVVGVQGDLQASVIFRMMPSSIPRIVNIGEKVGLPGASFTVGLAGFAPEQSIELNLYRTGHCSNPDTIDTCVVFLAALPPAQANARGEAVYMLTTQPDDPVGQYVISNNSLIAVSPNRHIEPCFLQQCGASFVVKVTNPTSYLAPIWSPDGTRLAYVSGSYSQSDIYTVRADGSELINLTNSPASYDSLAWSPDGTRIAFSSYREGQSGTYMMNADGSERVRLIDSETTPVWSPDGAKIAFILTGSFGQGDIFVVGVADLAPVNLTHNPARYESVNWSPDSAWIGYERDCNLQLMRADGSMQREISDAAADCVDSMAWSPDGAWIAFNQNCSLHIVSLDGSVRRDVIGNTASCIGDPLWSPDSSWVAFLRKNDIYVVGADGSGLTNLTENPATDTQLSWSPVSNKIAFVSGRDGDYDIYAINADGSGLRNLTDDVAEDERPSWSPDGTQIAFISDPDYNQQIYVMNADGTAPICVTCGH